MTIAIGMGEASPLAAAEESMGTHSCLNGSVSVLMSVFKFFRKRHRAHESRRHQHYTVAI